MLNAKAFANAATIVTVIVSFVCWVITVILPDFAFNVANSWFHMINLDAVRTNTTASLEEAFFGFLTLGIVVWVTTYGFVEIHNRLIKK